VLIGDMKVVPRVRDVLGGYGPEDRLVGLLVTGDGAARA